MILTIILLSISTIVLFISLLFIRSIFQEKISQMNAEMNMVKYINKTLQETKPTPQRNYVVTLDRDVYSEPDSMPEKAVIIDGQYLTNFFDSGFVLIGNSYFKKENVISIIEQKPVTEKEKVQEIKDEPK